MEDPLERLDGDGRMVNNLFLINIMRTGFSWLKIGFRAVHCNKLSESMKESDYLDQLRYHQLHTEDPSL
jgi:hypothetical protein